MINKPFWLCVAVIVISIMSTAFAADDAALKHDPFARPLLTATATNSESGEKNEEEMPWNPMLTAVMVAGKNSLITLDGMIMKLGEVKDGYRLVQVKDHEAVFKKGKKRIVLEIKAGAIRAGTESATGAEPTLEPQLDNEKSLVRQNKEQGSAK